MLSEKYRLKNRECASCIAWTISPNVRTNGLEIKKKCFSPTGTGGDSLLHASFTCCHRMHLIRTSQGKLPHTALRDHEWYPYVGWGYSQDDTSCDILSRYTLYVNGVTKINECVYRWHA